MGVKIRIDNPELTNEEQTSLSVDYNSGTSLSVRNNDGFEAQYFALVGEPTQEQTEIGIVSSISGHETIVLTTALKFSHPKSTPIYYSQWNKVSVERKVTTTWAAIASSPFDIDWDDDENSSLIKDTTGSSSYTYRWRFYNSVTGEYSSYSGELSGDGLERNQAGYVINTVRRNRQLTEGVEDEAMFEYMSDLHDIVYEQMPEAWWFEKTGTAISTVADTYRYSITSNWSDLLSIKYLLYRYVNGATDITYPLDYTALIEFYNMKADSNQQSDDNVIRWTLLPKDASDEKGYIGLDPTPDSTACYIQPIYSVELTDITSFSDTLLIPKPKIYEDYILYRIADDIKGDQPVADKYGAKFDADIKALKKRARRQTGQKDFLKFRGTKGYRRLFGGVGFRPYNDRVNYW